MHGDELVFILRMAILCTKQASIPQDRVLFYSQSLGRKGRLETYDSLFAIEGDVGIGIDYSGLMMVDKFPDVFPDELPSLPPDREIEFSINLVPELQPVSKTPYRMVPTELTEWHPPS